MENIMKFLFFLLCAWTFIKCFGALFSALGTKIWTAVANTSRQNINYQPCVEIVMTISTDKPQKI